MKILIISNLYPPFILGGYEILCDQVVSKLKERGHDTHILTSNHESSESSEHVERTMELSLPFHLPPKRFKRIDRTRAAKANYRITKDTIDRVRPDVIFIWSLLRTSPAPAQAAEDSGIPVFYTFNDENIAGYVKQEFQLQPKAIYHWMHDTFIFPKITLAKLSFENTTCISEVTKKNIIAKGVPIQSCKVIHQGIPVEKFPRRKFAFGQMHNPVRILYAGQLHDYKGVHTIIEALGKLNRTEGMPDYSLTIAGAGPEPYMDRLKQTAEELSVPAEFIGRVAHDQMSSTYQSHDLFIFPSIWEEPFGLTHLEAMASGLPVISTTNGGQGEFLKDRENCLAFPPGDADSLAEKIRLMLTDKELRRNIAIAGKDIAVGYYRFDRYVDELEAELKRIVMNA